MNTSTLLLILVVFTSLLYFYHILGVIAEYDKEGLVKVVLGMVVIAATITILILLSPEHLADKKIQKNHIVEIQVEQGDFLEGFIYELDASSNSIVISGFNEEKPLFFTQVYSNKRLSLPETWNNLTIKMTKSFYNQLKSDRVSVEFEN